MDPVVCLVKCLMNSILHESSFVLTILFGWSFGDFVIKGCWKEYCSVDCFIKRSLKTVAFSVLSRYICSKVRFVGNS